MNPLERNYHRILADYFLEKPLFSDPENRDLPNGRKCKELPWQLMKAEMWDRVMEIFSDLWFVDAKVRSKLVFELIEEYHRVVRHIGQNMHSKCVREIKKTIFDYSIFVRRYGGHFSQYPDSVFQAALNSPECYSQHNYVKEKIQTITSQRVLLRNINKQKEPWTAVMEFTGYYPCGFSPDGRFIYSKSEDKKQLIIRDFSTGKILCRLDHKEQISEHSVCFSQEGDYLATACGSDINIWATETWNQIRTLQGKAKITGLAFSPVPGRLASCSKNGRVWIWDYLREKKLQTLAEDFSFLEFCVYSPDASLLITGSIEGLLFCWDCRSNKLSWSKDIEVSCCKFSSDGSLLALAATNGHVIFINPRTSEVIREKKVSKTRHPMVYYLNFSSDGKTVAIACKEKAIYIYTLQPFELKKTFKGSNAAVVWLGYSPDSRFLISASRKGTISIWDTETEGMEPEALVKEYEIKSGVFLKEGKSCLICFDDYIKIINFDSELSSGDGWTIGEYGEVLLKIILSPEGDLAAITTSYGTIKILDVKSLKVVNELGEGIFPYKAGQYLTFCWGSKYIAATGEDRACIILWEVKTGSEARVFDYPSVKRLTSCVPFNRDHYFLCGSEEGDLLIVELFSNSIISKYKGHRERVTGCDISTNDKYLISSSTDGTIRIWEKESGICIKTLDNNTAGFSDCRYSPDGRWILSGTTDGTLFLQRTEDYKMMVAYKGKGPVSSVFWAPDSKYLGATETSGYLHLLQLEYGNLNDDASVRTPRKRVLYIDSVQSKSSAEPRYVHIRTVLREHFDLMEMVNLSEHIIGYSRERIEENSLDAIVTHVPHKSSGGYYPSTRILAQIKLIKDIPIIAYTGASGLGSLGICDCTDSIVRKSENLNKDAEEILFALNAAWQARERKVEKIPFLPVKNGGKLQFNCCIQLFNGMNVTASVLINRLCKMYEKRALFQIKGIEESELFLIVEGSDLMGLLAMNIQRGTEMCVTIEEEDKEALELAEKVYKILDTTHNFQLNSKDYL